MYAFADYYRALEAGRPEYAFTRSNILLLVLTVLTLVAGLALSSLPVMAIAGILSIATGASMQTSIISSSDALADNEVR
ncbi:MAG: hypothetical protein Q4G51_16280 [Dermatophilus congolensis]|nr:hypothetical protein [Dermatophilus congolensis]